ncbi:MAG: hypothetical protein HETSPECPRED_007510 [Heterodermia speciosa]|uniref:Uncharacterized protein n=1 Tax=Heterodermia speciosa TaxID=116794 RepID=A0A8H3FRX1_9LECA|nr:MAG: hypothetical protein HETSPECPRED_007510 [Heterodermia speciosa]
MVAVELKSPAPPIRWFYNYERQKAHGKGYSAREYEEKAAAVRERYEQMKRKYNDILGLEEDIVTDQEALDECECGNGANDIQVETERLRCEQNWARYRRDHPKFNQRHQASEHGVDSRCFNRFKDLPMEIKHQIYRHVLCGSQTGHEIRQWQLHYESRLNPFELRFTDLQPLDTRILAASREIYHSALHELYSGNTFIVDISKENATPLFVRDATGVLSPRPTSRIRRWHIRLSYADIADEDLIIPQMVAVRDAMKQCVYLEEIRFTWTCSSNGCPKKLFQSYDSMLRKFADVRGVGKVIFTEELSKKELGRIDKWLDGWGSVPQLASQDVREAVKASMESPRT